jgi:hypothetical protein
MRAARRRTVEQPRSRTDERSACCRTPITRELSGSPVSPGTGWPDDPATLQTPVASTAAQVRRLARDVGLEELDARISVCRACPRLVRWRGR